MKKMFRTGIAALFLATGTAHAYKAIDPISAQEFQTAIAVFMWAVLTGTAALILLIGFTWVFKQAIRKAIRK